MEEDQVPEIMELDHIKLMTKIDFDRVLEEEIDKTHEFLKKKGYVGEELRDEIIRHVLMEIAKEIIFGE